MMKRIKSTLALCLLSITTMTGHNCFPENRTQTPAVAKQNALKQFSLEDLIPGGTNFANLLPQRKNLTWWGNRCVERTQNACYVIGIKDGASKEILTLQQIKDMLGNEGEALNSCLNISFPYDSEDLCYIHLTQKDFILNVKDKKVVWSRNNPLDAQNKDWNKESKNLAYTKGNNLYVMTAQGEEIAVSTDGSEDGSDDLVYGKSVHRDEFGIHKGTYWNKEGNLLAFYRMDQSMVPNYPQVNINTRIATTFACKYPMAGEKCHKVSIGVFNPQKKTTLWLKTGDPTDRFFTNITWAPDGKRIYVIELNRDQNHAQLVAYNAQNGEREEVIYEEKHPKYVEPQHPIVFLPWDSSKFIYQSARDGYNHLYLFDLKAPLYDTFKPGDDGAQYKEYVRVKQITSGKWVVLDILGFNAREKSIIIQSNEKHPICHTLHAVDLVSTERTHLALKQKNKKQYANQGDVFGVHQALISPNGQYVIDTYSLPELARSIDLYEIKSGKGCNVLTDKDPWNEYKKPEIVGGSIKAADDSTDLYYRMIKPVDFDPNKKYPTVTYVYGGPHAHLVDGGWNRMARGWEIYMAQKGYLVFVLDSRGSEHRGQRFENATFRQLGSVEMQDQMRGVDFLKSLPYVDQNRMGIHGWSFGGFMTTNLMLSYPNAFKVGVAGGPVIDWKYYEIMYGERYMDTPQTNPDGYKEANICLKAGNLKGKLQVIIGYNDPVCVPQHSLAFLRACIDAGKQVDFFAYPGGEHNMVGRDRIHLHERITQYFDDYLK